MTPDRYEVSPPAGRRGETGFIQKRGTQTGAVWVGILLGAVFVAAGTVPVLIGMKVLQVDPASVHAPYWVLSAIGASFAAAGLMMWGMAWKQFEINRSRLEAIRQHPGEPALADYPWHPDGFEVSEWPGAAKAAALALGVMIFLSPFNWWALSPNGDRFVKTIVMVLDLAFSLYLWYAVRQLARAIKFGHSRVEFASFPCRLPNPAVIRWQPFGGINRVNKGVFTLRCVKEFQESQGSGENRTVTIVHEEIWSARWLLERPRNLQFKDKVELRYELPADAQPTRLSADKPVFWELEVKLDLPGLDFNETYLVPVYGPAQTVAAPAAV